MIFQVRWFINKIKPMLFISYSSCPFFQVFFWKDYTDILEMPHEIDWGAIRSDWCVSRLDLNMRKCTKDSGHPESFFTASFAFLNFFSRFLFSPCQFYFNAQRFEVIYIFSHIPLQLFKALDVFGVMMEALAHRNGSRMRIPTGLVCMSLK